MPYVAGLMADSARQGLVSMFNAGLHPKAAGMLSDSQPVNVHGWSVMSCSNEAGMAIFTAYKPHVRQVDIS